MNKRKISVNIIICSALLLSGCSTGKSVETTKITEEKVFTTTALTTITEENTTTMPVITTTTEEVTATTAITDATIITTTTTEMPTETTTSETSEILEITDADVSETTTVITAPPETTAPPPADTYDISYFSNDLFIGDSIYTGLYLYSYFPKSQVFAAVGMGPNTAATVGIDGETAAGRAKVMQPSRIFIMLGTNGLAYLDASYMADGMAELVRTLQEASPESDISIISIPPVTYKHELAGNETMAKVNKYNSLLENTASECGVRYLDLCSQLQNEEGYFSSLYAEADGLHFLGAAYKRMLSFLQRETQ